MNNTNDQPVRIGRYQLGEKIATGGMAEIFQARVIGAHGFEKTVVIKRILPHLATDKSFVSMFIEEAKVMVQMSHPKIVQVLDFGDHEGTLYLVMEYVRGIDGLLLLRRCARLRCRPTTAIAVHVASELLDALEYAHNLKDAAGKPLGIIHRDISPSNIFLSELGEIKLGDFGIAVSAHDGGGSTIGKALKGKYGYMAPELVSDGTIDHRADLFSVAVVLAEFLMIRRLFIGASELEVLFQVRDANLQRLELYGRHIDSDLRCILEAAMTREPSDRYQTAAAFRDALHRYLYDQRLMVRSNDVKRFLERLASQDQEADAAAEPRQASSSTQDGFSSVNSPAPPREMEPAAASAAKGTSSEPKPPPAEAPRGAPSATRETSTERMPGADPDAVSRRPSVDTGYVARGERVAIGAQRNLAISAPLTAAAAADTDTDTDDDDDDDDSSSGEYHVLANRPRTVVGRKRKITIGPPPPLDPIPSVLQETGEAPRLSTAHAIAAIREVSADADSHLSRDFATHSSREAEVPASDRLVTVERASSLEGSEVTPWSGDALELPKTPTRHGSLSAVSLTRLLFELAVDEETGLIRLKQDEARKDIYIVDGHPQYVASNLPHELFGQYLLRRTVLTEGELAMALAMLPHFQGKLGDALVSLKLLRPVQVLRYLTQQVREKLLAAFTWTAGSFAYYAQERSQREAAPLGLDAFEIIGAGVKELPPRSIQDRLEPIARKSMRQRGAAVVPPEVFRLGDDPRTVFDKFDGKRTIGELIERYDDIEQRLQFARVIYLLLETQLIVEG